VCGIAGIIGPGTDPATLVPMLACLAHRGPDDSGTWAEPSVALGHRRLSILDLSSAGHQPMGSTDDRFVITFNGEIYNHEQVRGQLRERGHHFRSRTDTEVVLAAFAQWGTAALERLVGMFALAIWDRDLRTLTLARDRLGEKPLYYAHLGDRLVFGSEIAAVTAVPWVPSSIDPAATRLFLAYRDVPAPWTIHRSIRKLPPAHLMQFHDGRMSIQQYWRPMEQLSQPRLRLDATEALEALQDLLSEAVRQQMVADVPVGAFLSGGTDSSLVAALMVEHSTRPVRTFTVGFGDPEYDEAADATRVAQYLGTQHSVDYLDEPTVLALVPELPRMYGEPFADPSALPSRLVSARARRDVAVCLTGDGGDECFGGYNRYDVLERYGAPLEMLRPVAPLAHRLAPRLSGSARRLATVAGLSPEDLHRHALGITASTVIERLTGGSVPLYPPHEAWGLSGQTVRRRAMATDLIAYLPDQLLVKVDRAAMSVGLETRAPLLDHRVVEFSLRLPDRYLRGKPLLKELLYQRVPRALVDRPKQGFTVPLARWLRGELRPLLHDTLTAARLAEVGIEDRALVADLCRRHDAGEDHSDILWALLMLCLWAATPGARPHSG